MPVKDLLKAAEKYISKNLSVIATDSTKKALFPWKKYQEQIISKQEITSQLSHHKASGIAIICGAVSGNLEVIDIDSKNDLTGNLYQNIIDNIPSELLDKLRITGTRSGGYHLYYRCRTIEGNQKLAMRGASESELKDSPHLKEVVLIETRGEKGYILAPPTDGYTIIQRREVPEITTDEREMILEICRSFSELSEEKKIYPKERAGYGVTPWDDYNGRADCVALLEKHGWSQVRTVGERTYLKRPGKTDSQTSGDYHHGLNIFKAFTTSSQFEVGKGYTPFGVFCLLEHKGNATEANKQLVRDGYGEKAHKVESKYSRSIRKIREMGGTDDQVKEKLIQNHGLSISDATDVLSDYDKQAGKQISTFWDVDDKGKITISRSKFERFLRDEGGFYLFFYSATSNIYRIVQEKDGFLEEVSPERIKKFIKKYIQSLEPFEPFDHGTTSAGLMEVILRGADTYFSKGLLEFLDSKDFDFFKDTKHAAFFPFNNSVVSVEKDRVSVKSYGEVGKVIWKSQVIPRDITIDENFDPSLSEFYKFIQLISGKDEEKTEYCLSLIGYLLHKYKDSSRPWSIILAEETEDEQKGGGTGKGILVKAISELCKTERIDGKNFKIDKNFAFQRVGLDTRIMAIEDVRKNVDFEGFYSIITEGVTVEKKNKDELYIKYDESPKVIFTTNYTISSVGVHAKRRQRTFEFAPYFSNTHTPIDEFGHKFFDDWDTDEWNRFYNLMFYCVKMYLKNGVKEMVNSKSLHRKHIKLSYTTEFLDYLDGFLSNGAASWHQFSEAYAVFLTQADLDKKEYSMKRFKKAMTESVNILGFNLQDRQNRQNQNRKEFRIEGLPEGHGQMEPEKEEFDF